MNWIMYGFGFTSGILALYYRRKEERKRAEGLHVAFKSFLQSMEEHSEQERESKEVH